jgi:Tfp pilus assembly protein PilE
MRKRFWKGLRTIDLAIIAILIAMILGVVAARFDNFKCRAIESEAKFSLYEIYAAQKRYHAKHDHYATLDTLMVKEGQVIVPQRYYLFSDGAKPTKDTFSVRALGLEGTLVGGEQWSINEHNDLSLIKSMCQDRHLWKN